MLINFNDPNRLNLSNAFIQDVSDWNKVNTNIIDSALEVDPHTDLESCALSDPNLAYYIQHNNEYHYPELY